MKYFLRTKLNIAVKKRKCYSFIQKETKPFCPISNFYFLILVLHSTLGQYPLEAASFYRGSLNYLFRNALLCYLPSLRYIFFAFFFLIAQAYKIFLYFPPTSWYLFPPVWLSSPHTTVGVICETVSCPFSSTLFLKMPNSLAWCLSLRNQALPILLLSSETL